MTFSGIPYLIREGNNVELARLDLIELNRCPTQDQSKLPTDNSLLPFFFYGSHKKRWISQECIEGPILKEHVDNKFESFARVKKPFPASFEKAYKEFITNPWKNFQLEGWKDECGVVTMTKISHFLGGKKIEKLPGTEWDDKESKIIVDLNPKMSALVYDDHNAPNDPLQQNFKDALHTVQGFDIGDVIGAVYTDTCMGVVVDKDAEKILVYKFII